MLVHKGEQYGIHSTLQTRNGRIFECRLLTREFSLAGLTVIRLWAGYFPESYDGDITELALGCLPHTILQGPDSQISVVSVELGACRDSNLSTVVEWCESWPGDCKWSELVRLWGGEPLTSADATRTLGQGGGRCEGYTR